MLIIHLRATRLRTALLAAIAALPAVVAPFASAAEPKAVSVALVAKKVVATTEGEKLAAAAVIKPGDVVQYEAVYRNDSKNVVSNLVATVPVPGQLALVADSVTPSGALASADGKTFERMPLVRTVLRTDGTAAEELVPLAEYRALRWNIAQLASGERATVCLRARVVTESSSK